MKNLTFVTIFFGLPHARKILCKHDNVPKTVLASSEVSELVSSFTESPLYEERMHLDNTTLLSTAKSSIVSCIDGALFIYVF